MSAAQKRRQLRSALHGPDPLCAPGVYDGYGLRLVQQAGFSFAYISGNAVSACLLGQPDLGLVDLTLMADHLRRITPSVDLPVICDADAGHGGPLNIRRLVYEFEQAGVAGFHIEDQVQPKQCAQLPGARSVVSRAEAAARIRAACTSRSCASEDALVIIGRTDCAAALGDAEAIARGRDYLDAGADAVFIELKPSPDLLERVLRVRAEVGGPCVVNMSIDPQLMALKPSQWRQSGIDLAIFPALARGVFGLAMQEALTLLGSEQHDALASKLLTAQAYGEVLGLAEAQAWSARFQ
ncbi:MAG: isocitrate lyase/PEP mutase family protein [Burkholderiaceae bacterium]